METSKATGLAGPFSMAGENVNSLLSMLPPVVHIQEAGDKAVLRWCLERMSKEVQAPQPGSSLVMR